LGTLANRLGELLEANGCYLALWNAGNPPTQLAAVSEQLKREPVRLAAGRAGIGPLTETVLKGGQACVMPEGALGEAGAAAVLSLPLIADGQWLGAAHLIY